MNVAFDVHSFRHTGVFASWVVGGGVGVVEHAQSGYHWQ